MTDRDAMFAILEHGRTLVRRSLCPACDVVGKEQQLQADPPAGFHYHTADPTQLYDPPRLWCPVDGQGYRLKGPDAHLLITVPCNGGLHSDGQAGYR